MTIAEKIYALWSASASAVALVPASRFKLSGLYQNIDCPYVIYSRVTGERVRTHTEGAGNKYDADVWQFSIHTNGATASSVAEAIRLKLIEVYDGNKGGFNFHYRGPGPTIVSQDQQYILTPVDFFITSA